MEKWCCKKRPKTLNVIEAIKNANMQKKLLTFCMNDSNWKNERTKKKCLNDSDRAKTLKCKSINLTKIRTINLMNRNWRVSFHGFGSSLYNFLSLDLKLIKKAINKFSNKEFVVYFIKLRFEFDLDVELKICWTIFEMRSFIWFSKNFNTILDVVPSLKWVNCEIVLLIKYSKFTFNKNKNLVSYNDGKFAKFEDRVSLVILENEEHWSVRKC